MWLDSFSDIPCTFSECLFLMKVKRNLKPHATGSLSNQCVEESSFLLHIIKSLPFWTFLTSWETSISLVRESSKVLWICCRIFCVPAMVLPVWPRKCLQPGSQKKEAMPEKQLRVNFGFFFFLCCDSRVLGADSLMFLFSPPQAGGNWNFWIFISTRCSSVKRAVVAVIW